MVTKIYDCAVAVGKYTARDGQERSRWENIGSIWQDIPAQGEKYHFMTIKRTFNPAGIQPLREGSDSIYISLFKPRNNNNGSQSGARQNQGNDNAQDFNPENIEQCPF